MVGRQGATPLTAALTPERRLARRVFAEHHSTVPVDVLSILSSLADVEEIEDLPDGVDAILVRPRGSKVPRVLLNRRQATTRKRFTMAHEIGHLVIPWHLGGLGCQVSAFSGYEDFITKDSEKEANGFAAELLMPEVWLGTVLGEAKSMADALNRFAEEAQVSRTAMAFALVRHAPASMMFIEISNDRVVAADRSPSTAAPLPMFEGRLDLAEYERIATRTEVVRVSPSRRFYWFTFEPVGPGKQKSSGDPSTVILGRIRERHGLPPEVLRRVNGILGSANSMWGKESGADELVSIFRQRFLNRDDLTWLTQDKEFASFLRTKAEEIIELRIRDS